MVPNNEVNVDAGVVVKKGPLPFAPPPPPQPHISSDMDPLGLI